MEKYKPKFKSLFNIAIKPIIPKNPVSQPISEKT
ncbi:MAG: hypothetical protein ACD_12C00518G0002 [uncultured bacterium]|nr:MAG: hypothetical protein ACD_12C00518G0002 [uncultured bacterium]